MKKHLLSLVFITYIFASAKAQNVGIGTSSPATKLHIDGGALGIGRQDALDQTPYLQLGLNDGYFQYLANNAQYNSSTDVWNYVATGGYGGLASKIEQYSGYIKFSTANGGVNPINWNDRLYIGNDGNVGIGTNSPLQKLQLTNNGDVALGFSTNNGGTPTQARIRVTDNNWSGDIIFETTVPGSGSGVLTERMRINNIGNVGIGTSSPSQLLSLSSASPTIEFRDTDHRRYWLHNNSNVFYLLFDGDNDGGWDGNHPFQFHGLARDNASLGTMAYIPGKMQLRATAPNGMVNGANQSQLEISNAGIGPAFISFHREGAWGAHFGLDTDNWFSTQGWSPGAGYNSLRAGNIYANGEFRATNLSGGGDRPVFANNDGTMYPGIVPWWQQGAQHCRLGTGTNEDIDLSTSFGWDVYNWNALCFISEIRGNMAGAGEIARTYLDGNGRWRWQFNSGQSSFGACVRCFRLR